MMAWLSNNRLSRWAAASLQRKFALIAGLLLVATSVVFLVLLTNGYRNRILAAHERASLSVNLLLQATLENAMIKRDLEGLQEIVTRLGAQEGINGVMIVNPEGEVRFSSYPDRLYLPLGDAGLGRALESRSHQTGFRSLTGGSEVLRSINPVHNRAECLECHGKVSENPVNGLLVVDYDSAGVRRDARNGAIVLGLLGVLVLLVIEGGLWIALRRIVLNRIDHLGNATKQLAGGDLQVRADEDGRDEVARLAGGFNHMAAQMEQTLDDLAASQAFLQALIDAVPDGIRVIDSNYRILMANDSYCAQIGTKREEVIGQFCYASSHRRDTPCAQTMVHCPVAELLDGNEATLKCSHTHIGEDGSDIPVEVSAATAMVTIDGVKVPCVVEAIRDLETQLNISQEQRLSEMGMLAAGVAHEVYNPLSSIALALRSVASEEGQSEKTKRYIRIAEDEIANCLAFTDSLLKLAAPPQKTAGLVELQQVVCDTVSLLSFEAKQAGVQLKYDIEGNPRVLASDSDMRILIFNILHNAIHAMPDGGTARVTVRAEGDFVRLEFSDTGVGISERDKQRIMLPFWTRRSDGSRGRGLGLSIVKTIIDRLGGVFRVDSQIGEGATFHIDLPNADGRGA